jgi:flagellar biosynthesis protein FlhA
VLIVPLPIRRAVARAIGAILPVLALEEIPETMALQIVQTAEPAVSHA